MTRETAINLLDDLIGMVEDNQGNNYDEAFKMAIRSLKSWDEDVVPVVHGKWIKGVCDKCGFDWAKVAPIANVPNYCPHCGTKMGGATNKEESFDNADGVNVRDCVAIFTSFKTKHNLP